MEHLIESVRKYPCLWKIDSPQYKDNELKEAAWEEVFNECDFPSVAEIKSLWKKLRDGHRQAINTKKKTTTGQAADHKCKWKYEQQMEFLLPFMKNRTTHTNVVRNEHPEDSLTGEESLDSSCETKPKKNKTIHSILEDEHRRREIRHEERNILRKQIIENTSKNENKNTAMEKFFFSMCDTTCQLPDYLQIKIQRQIFNIVMDAKEQHLMRVNSQGSSNTETMQIPPLPPQANQYARFITPLQQTSRPYSSNSSYQSQDQNYSPETLQSPPSPPPPQSSHYGGGSQNAGSSVRFILSCPAPVQHSTRSPSYASPDPVHSPQTVNSPLPPPQPSQSPAQSDFNIRNYIKDFSLQ